MQPMAGSQVSAVQALLSLQSTGLQAKQFSTSAFTVGESVVLWQSLGFFASSFAKQPFACAPSPVYFATALSTQTFVFGSVGFLGVWASLRLLSGAHR